MIGLILRSKEMVFAALTAILEGAPHCRLVSPEGFGAEGAFHQVHNDHLHIQLNGRPEGFELAEGTTVEIITQYRGLAAKHTCLIVKSDDAGLLYVSLPEEIVLTDAREYARLTLPSHVNLVVEFDENTVFEGAKVVDVSHGGFRLCGSEDALARFASGAVGHCRISLGDRSVRLDYAVMWKREDSVGFMIIGMRKVHPREKTHPWVAFLDEVVIAALQNPA